MATKSRITFYNNMALLCGIWFLLTAWLWTYLMNLVISLPFGILGMILWLKGKKADPANKWSKITLIVLLAGVAVFVIAFAIFHLFN
jgi:hypothetical protein